MTFGSILVQQGAEEGEIQRGLRKESMDGQFFQDGSVLSSARGCFQQMQGRYNTHLNKALLKPLWDLRAGIKTVLTPNWDSSEVFHPLSEKQQGFFIV